MATYWFPNGLEGFGSGDVDWDANTFDVVALTLDGTLTDTSVKQVTGATNATPIVLTITSHGWANGDIIVVRGVGGNTAANGTWKVANQATNTVELTTVKDGLNSTGNGAFTTNGCAINLTQADFYDDIDGAAVATGGISGDLASKTNADGVLDAADVTFTSMNGTAHAVVLRRDTGAAGTSRNLVFNDGKIQVVCAANAANGATTLWVEPIANDIPNSSVLIFSNGLSVTMTAGATAGARSLTVSALGGSGVNAGHTADVQATGTGIPFSTTNGNVTLQWATAGIAAL